MYSEECYTSISKFVIIQKNKVFKYPKRLVMDYHETFVCHKNWNIVKTPVKKNMDNFSPTHGHIFQYSAHWNFVKIIFSTAYVWRTNVFKICEFKPYIYIIIVFNINLVYLPIIISRFLKPARFWQMSREYKSTLDPKVL